MKGTPSNSPRASRVAAISAKDKSSTACPARRELKDLPQKSWNSPARLPGLQFRLDAAGESIGHFSDKLCSNRLAAALNYISIQISNRVIRGYTPPDKCG